MARARRLLPLALAAAFAVLVVARLHGFSLAAWHGALDGSPAPEVLLGEARAVRVDDWRVLLPLAFAQIEHDPPFPLVNDDIGLGQPMALPLQLPVATPLVLFRPTLWGFFLGKDTGMAWLWWSSALGLFYAAFLAFGILTGGRAGLSALGALALLYSPFFQFWSLNFASVAIYAALLFVAGHRLLTEDRPRRLLLAALLGGFAGGCFLLVVYPPFQVSLAWWVAALLAATAWQRRAVLTSDGRLPLRIAAAAAALLVAAAAGALLFAQAGEAIAALQATAYPGARVSTGGELAPWRAFSNNLAFAWQVERWAPLRNISASSSFPLFFPVVALGLALGPARARRDPFVAALLALCLAFFAYASFGVPEWLARATGLSRVPSERSVIGLGLADASLLLRFLAVGAGASRRWLAPVGAAAFGVLLLGVAHFLRLRVPELSPGWLAAAAAVNVAVAWLILQGRRPRAALALLAAGCVASTAWFNPLARGGAAYLAENPLSRRLLEIDGEHGGDTRWLALGSPHVPNLFRALGIASVAGTQPVPQLALWRRLDPDGRYERVYNRYANFIPEPARRGRPAFALRSIDSVLLAIAPDAPELDRLGVTHLVISGDDGGAWADRPSLRRLGVVGEHHLYARAPRAAPD